MANPVDSKESKQPDNVSYSELDSAYQEATKVEGSVKEPEKVETKPEEEVKPETQIIDTPTQADRTQLGRKVKRLEESLETILQKLDQIGQVQIPSHQQVGTTDDVPEFVSTPDDVKKIYRKIREEEQSVAEKYQTSYARAIYKMENEIDDPKLAEEVEHEIFANPQAFNKVLSDNPSIDAEVNFNKAMASVLRKKLATPQKTKPNVKGETPIAPTGATVGSTSKGTSEAPIELDDFAKEFVKVTGMSPEHVKAALSGETPIGLNRGR